MRVITETEVENKEDFEFWSGAVDTVEELTDEEFAQVINILESANEEPMTDTQLNDFMWFERETIAEWLGFNSFDEIMECNNKN